MHRRAQALVAAECYRPPIDLARSNQWPVAAREVR
jgi:hypothetical protein